MLHPAVFLVHYLTLMSMTSVFAVTTSHTLTRTSHSVVVPFTRITFPAFNVFDAQAHSKQKKKKKHGWPELRAGGKPQSHLFSKVYGFPVCRRANLFMLRKFKMQETPTFYPLVLRDSETSFKTSVKESDRASES